VGRSQMNYANNSYNRCEPFARHAEVPRRRDVRDPFAVKDHLPPAIVEIVRHTWGGDAEGLSFVPMPKRLSPRLGDALCW
jgi:hypothetical protein